ncbi:MAG: hypothetical protein KGR26_01270, partial [Cyanobacteria bacterium REEB65]|nr:hypothetical protein [Cyanobacteria bacterium REEB65]
MTAKFVAYMRQFSDIPFAKEVAQWLAADSALQELRREHELDLDELALFAPLFEVRYKSLAAAIRQSGIRQVLEIASGVSLRGLHMAIEDQIAYVETDLP